ncbi:MAG: hypothetical protein IJ725_01675 [Ruminococcus sp.]|nr:hypothetical protein [Ruminococcus sp.]
MKKLISVLLTALLIFSAVPAVSAADGDSAAISDELNNLPDDFADAVNKYIPDYGEYGYYPTFTMENLDGIEFYKITKEQVISRITGLKNSEARQLINGYLFTAPTSFGSWSNRCGYCVYSEGSVYDMYNAVVWLKIITASELAEIIPDTVELNDENLVSYFNEKGVDVTWVKFLGNYTEQNILCYAGNGTTKETDETILLGDYTFNITTAQSPYEFGLYIVTASSVMPIDKYDTGYNYNTIVTMIRKAEAEGVHFGFTTSNKYGDEAEACISVMNSQSNYPYSLLGFGKLKNHNCYALSVSYGVGLQAMTFSAVFGNWWFFSDGQNSYYYLGIYIVDVEGNKIYNLEDAYDGGVLSDEDIDDVIDKIGTSGSGWSATKLTEIQKKFLVNYYGEGYESFGHRHIYPSICKDLGEFDGFTVIGNGNNVEMKLGDYIVNTKKGALYIYKDDKFRTLSEAYSDGLINDNNIEAFLTYLEENEIASKRIPDAVETAIVNRLNEDDNDIISADYVKLCDVNDCEFYKVIAGRGEYSAIIGDFTVTCPTSGAHPIIIKNGEAYDLKEACDKNLVDIEEVYIAYSAKPSSNSIFQFIRSKHNYHAFIDYVMNNNEGISKSEIKVKRYDVLANGSALVDYYVKVKPTDFFLETYLIDKYAYTPDEAPLKIFDGKEMYEIADAYNKDIIGKTELSEISKLLSDFNESKLTFKAGYSNIYLNLGASSFDAKTFTSSAPKIATVKSGKLIALTKGTATLTCKPKNGKSYSVKVTVKNNPTITKNGKAVSTVTVKKGKTVSVRVNGKAAEINNVYKNTKFAKVISAKSAKVIKIRGLKNGTATLKITVNGKVFKLKVKVKK